MAAPTQEFPPWLTASEVVETDAAGVPTATRTTVLYLPLTYLGPSIPLGNDFSFGGTTYPPTIVTGFATPTISSTTAIPPTTTSTSTTATPSLSSSSSPSSISSSIPTTSSSPSTTFIPSSSSTVPSSSTEPPASSTSTEPTEPTSTAMSSASRGRLVGAIVSGILILLFLFVILLATYLYFKGRARRRHAYSPTSPNDPMGALGGANYYSSGSFTSGEYAILSDDEVVRSKAGAERLKLIGGIAGGATDGRLVERSPRQSGEEGDTLLRPSRTPPTYTVGGQLVQAPQQMQQLPSRRPVIDTSLAAVGAVGVARNLSSSSSVTRSPVKRVPVPPLDPHDSSSSSPSNPSIPPQPSQNLSELGVAPPSTSSNGQVQGNTQNSQSSSGSSRPSTTDYGTLLERPRFQFGFGGLGGDQEQRTSGVPLTSEEMHRLNANENVLPEGSSGSDDRYSGAYALSRDLPPIPSNPDPEGIFGGAAAIRQRTDSNEEEYSFGNINPNLPPPRLVTREHRPRDSVGSYPSMNDAEDAALLTARRVRVGSPEDRALAGESGSSGSGILGAIGLSGLSWFGSSSNSSGGGNRGSDHYSPVPSRRQSRFAGRNTPSPTGSFSAVPVYDPYEDFDVPSSDRPYAPVPPPVTRPGLLVGLSPDGTRPSSRVSTSGASGVTLYHDAASSLPGTPNLAVPARAMTPGGGAGGVVAQQATRRTPPPSYEEHPTSYRNSQASQQEQQVQSQYATQQQQLASNVDILDLPAPSALISHQSTGETGTVSSIGLNKYPVPPGLEFLSGPPGLGLIIKTKDSAQDLTTSSRATSVSTGSSPALPWGYTRSPLGSIREGGGGYEPYGVVYAGGGTDTLDMLEDAPPGAQEGWRSIASARQGGQQGQVPVSARRAGSGFSGLPQYHHSPMLIPSEHGSLHSMRSHVNPPSVRSTGSAAAASTINSGSISSSVSASSSKRLSAHSSSARSRGSAVESLAGSGDGIPRMGSLISDGHRRYPSGTGYQTPPRVVSPADLGRAAFGKTTIDGSSSALPPTGGVRVSPAKSGVSSSSGMTVQGPTIVQPRFNHARTESEIEMDIGAVRRVSGRWEEAPEEVLPLQGMGSQGDSWMRM